MPSFILEDQIERAMVQRLVQLHSFDSLNCNTEDLEDLNDRSGRTSKREVILFDRLIEATSRLNPTIPTQVVESALEQLLDRCQAMTLAAANQEVYNLLFDNAEGQPQKERVRLIDFNAPENNRYLAVTQL